MHCSELLGLPKLIDRLQVQGKAGYLIPHQHSAGGPRLDRGGKVRQRFAMPRKTSPVALTALTGVSNPTGR